MRKVCTARWGGRGMGCAGSCSLAAGLVGRKETFALYSSDDLQDRKRHKTQITSVLVDTFNQSKGIRLMGMCGPLVTRVHEPIDFPIWAPQLFPPSQRTKCRQALASYLKSSTSYYLHSTSTNATYIPLQ